MSATYTVFSPDDACDPHRGLTLAEAAAELLTADEYRWEIRPDNGGGWRLWLSQFSEASTLGGRPLVSSVFFSLRDDRATAEAEIFSEMVATDDWHGLAAMTDADFRDYAARVAEARDEEG